MIASILAGGGAIAAVSALTEGAPVGSFSLADVEGPGLAGALLLALLIGARHATDADHLTAVSALVLDDRRAGWRRAGSLGLWWGIGHGASMFALGLPLALFGSAIPETAARLAEVGVGVLIVALALRVLVRWRRGYFHWHPHLHDGERHAHPHFHDHPEGAHPHPEHGHAHFHEDARTPLASLGVGLVHGVGGSAGAGVLMVAAIPGTTASVLALALLATATAAAMGAAALALGWLITRESVSRTLPRLVPVFALSGIVFGVWFAVAS